MMMIMVYDAQTAISTDEVKKGTKSVVKTTNVEFRGGGGVLLVLTQPGLMLQND